MEADELEVVANDTIVANGLDIEEDEEEYDHHESFKRGIRKAER
ncbi:hypothetical protein [Paenibacillus aestuarii]|uniref:YfhD family protein n=1 Tax=Paenibacillus aestuarii TaxID=516965 RepID=A0ABW0K2Z3_9BACL|nr:hypothetical protein [Paenibacillus aestuarii]